MSEISSLDHWQAAWTDRDSTGVSWYEPTPGVSLSLIRKHCAVTTPSVIDIGGGASALVDNLLASDHGDLAVLDIAAPALDVAKTRLGPQAENVDWIVSNILDWQPNKNFDIWHDRAAFHFLTEMDDQRSYIRVMEQALKVGGILIIGTFAPGGPEKCSGLPVRQHDAESLSALLGVRYELLEQLIHMHSTPGGAMQKFSFCAFRRTG
ncbi:class I SAM-dependent methyltransferase [Roseibium sp.]|uniref:class I SAM-dependent methyltransferase n=1 Tax=Roseibium sp. TaxID=1936156 RepID=UPI003A9742CB